MTDPEASFGTRGRRGLEGKVAIVTGAGSGLGRAISRRLATEGAAVACADLDPAAAEATCESLQGAIALRVDVTSSADVARMTDAVARGLGGVDIVVANAGIAGPGTAEEVDESDWNRVIAVNLTGVWLTARFAIPHLRKRGGGSIVTIASIAALVGIRGLASYTAAKGGVVALTRQMAADLAPEGIRVNTVCPGTVPTPLVMRTLAGAHGLSGIDGTAEERLAEVAERYPLGRVGMTDDVAAAVAYLVSQDGGWITGAVLPVDGGITNLART